MRHSKKDEEEFGFKLDVPHSFTGRGTAYAISVAAFFALAYVLLTSTIGLRGSFDISKYHESGHPTTIPKPSDVKPSPAHAEPPREPPQVVAQSDDDQMVAPDAKKGTGVLFNPYPAPYAVTLRPTGPARSFDGGSVTRRTLKPPLNIDPRIVNNLPELVFIPYGIDGPKFILCWDIPRELQIGGMTKKCVPYGVVRGGAK